MRLVAGFILALACTLVGAPLSADQGTYPKTDAELDAAYDALQWRTESKSYQLERSHAVFKLRSGQALLLDRDAERYSWLANGVEFPDTEAMLTYDGGNSSAEVYLEWRDEGYVDDSDWADVDGDELLAQYRDATEDSNAERVANGFDPMQVVGWLERPHYDEASRTVTYAIELKDKNGNWANAVALRLGRAGYTEFTWVGSIDAFQGAGNRPALLDQALAAHEFEEGYRYADFKDGDPVAAYGVAGLVATALGLKFGKGLIAALIALLVAGKKVVIPAILVFGGALAAFARRWFRRRDTGS